MKARDNPFRVECIDRLHHRPVGWTWEQFEARLIELDFRGAIIGPHGSGKTTLLNDLEVRLTERGDHVARFMLTDEIRSTPSQFLAACNSERIVILDGAEQLASGDWRVFLRRTAACRGLIISSHRPGLLPTLVQCRTTPDLLEQVLKELLLPEMRNGLGDLPLRLWRKHHGNLHEVFRELYHVASTPRYFASCQADVEELK